MSCSYVLRPAAVLVLFLAGNAAAAPATIVNVIPGGVGYVTHATGTNGVSAQVGRWDTAYPNSGNGAPAPGLEPHGASTLEIEIAVNDGGLVSFGYQFLSYDAGIYDWFDIFLVTPDGTQTLVNALGKPGSTYGTYWESPLVPYSLSLNQWRNEHVSFVFAVQQDGWGDQSAARISNFAIRGCAVTPFTEMTDPDALHFENVESVDLDRLNASMKTGLDCLRQQVKNVSGTLTVTSGYRPRQYQLHLGEVWSLWGDLKNTREAECSTFRDQVKQEWDKHKLKARPAPPSGKHTTGEAFDASWTLPRGADIDTLADSCGLWRRVRATDPVHFEHR